MADGVRPEETKVRHANKCLSEVHGVVENPIEAQLGTGAVFQVKSTNSVSRNLSLLATYRFIPLER